MTIPSEIRENWPVIILAVVTIFYIAVVRPLKSKKKKKDPLDGSPRMSLSTERSVEREMNNLLVEMSNMARQISSQLDTRATKLQMLIEEADKKIERLEKLEGRTSEDAITTLLTPPVSERVERVEEVKAVVATRVKENPPAGEGLQQASAQAVQQASSQAVPEVLPQVPGEVVGKVGKAAPAVVKTKPRKDEIDKRHGEIYSLADAGKTALEISQRLQRPRGEIELILALRPRG